MGDKDEQRTQDETLDVEGHFKKRADDAPEKGAETEDNTPDVEGHFKSKMRGERNKMRG